MAMTTLDCSQPENCHSCSAKDQHIAHLYEIIKMMMEKNKVEEQMFIPKYMNEQGEITDATQRGEVEEDSVVQYTGDGSFLPGEGEDRQHETGIAAESQTDSSGSGA